jgi:hypothetical protein
MNLPLTNEIPNFRITHCHVAQFLGLDLARIRILLGSDLPIQPILCAHPRGGRRALKTSLKALITKVIRNQIREQQLERPFNLRVGCST